MANVDASFIVDLLNDPAFLRYIGDKAVRTTDDALRYMAEGPMASHAKFGFGLDLVCLKPAGTPIGMCGLLKRDTLPEPDIGFAYLASYCGRGYGFEAAEATLSHAREVLHIPRVLAITSPDNAASIRLLEKLGFQFERIASLSPASPEVRLFSRALQATHPTAGHE